MGQKYRGKSNFSFWQWGRPLVLNPALITYWFAQPVVGGNMKSSHQSLHQTVLLKICLIFCFYKRLGGSIFQRQLRKCFDQMSLQAIKFCLEETVKRACTLHCSSQNFSQVLFSCKVRATSLSFIPRAKSHTNSGVHHTAHNHRPRNSVESCFGILDLLYCCFQNS